MEELGFTPAVGYEDEEAGFIVGAYHSPPDLIDSVKDWEGNPLPAEYMVTISLAASTQTVWVADTVALFRLL